MRQTTATEKTYARDGYVVSIQDLPDGHYTDSLSLRMPDGKAEALSLTDLMTHWQESRVLMDGKPMRFTIYHSAPGPSLRCLDPISGSRYIGVVYDRLASFLVRVNVEPKLSVQVIKRFCPVALPDWDGWYDVEWWNYNPVMTTRFGRFLADATGLRRVHSDGSLGPLITRSFGAFNSHTGTGPLAEDRPGYGPVGVADNRFLVAWIEDAPNPFGRILGSTRYGPYLNRPQLSRDQVLVIDSKDLSERSLASSERFHQTGSQPSALIVAATSPQSRWVALGISKPKSRQEAEEDAGRESPNEARSAPMKYFAVSVPHGQTRQLPERPWRLLGDDAVCLHGNIITVRNIATGRLETTMVLPGY